MKTKSSKIREVTLCNPTKELLSDIFKRLKPDDFLFGKSRKIPFTADYVSKTFKKAVRGK